MVPSAPDARVFCFIKLPLMDRSLQASMLSHWMRDYVILPPSGTMGYVGTEAVHFPSAWEPADRTGTSSIRLGSYPQDHFLPSDWAPSLIAGSMPLPSDLKSLEYDYLAYAHPTLNLKTSCCGPCLAVPCTGLALGQGRNYQQTTSPRHPGVLISVACTRVFPHLC